jgi:hypothetical protein
VRLDEQQTILASESGKNIGEEGITYISERILERRLLAASVLWDSDVTL